MNSGEIPPVVRQLVGGVIIKLSLEGITDELKKLIQLDHMLSDDELVQYLETYLANIRRSKISIARESPYDIVLEFMLNRDESVGLSTEQLSHITQLKNETLSRGRVKKEKQFFQK